MPSTSLNGQPRVTTWFASPAGRILLDGEDAMLERSLAERPSPPWLWLAPAPRRDPGDACGRGMCLWRDRQGWAGAVRCGTALPLPSATMRVVILQHVVRAGGEDDDLLEEAARVLEPGGRLWLFTLNPLSPYRWRWRGQGLRAAEPLGWRRRLRRAGLEPEPVSQGIGPQWKLETSDVLQSGPGLRAAYALRAEKRVAALTPLPSARLALPRGLPAA
ncbi:methyltransferase domain-containing protein [Luteimonas sp. MHLX1A]|uniref:methyltransferase domain-containing protein n=1 Tax=Alterluteimonas muca TaxID=2878684 RepID=UPI001E396D3E|nr:methyltransferase domain-containing protein [Luteimonas sp. MHLX1A]MCD9045965.1 methyltransferase domain-containing protein [Luteimonas sp. MHLX1A]